MLKLRQIKYLLKKDLSNKDIQKGITESLLASGSTALYVWLIVLAVFIVVIALFVGIVPISVWIRAMVSGAHISALRLVGMKLRHIEVGMLVDCFINAKKAGVNLTIDDLETHYMPP